VTTNQLQSEAVKKLGEQLKNSLALNSLDQVIVKIDVAVEGLQRLLDDVKRVRDKLVEHK
jgi:hypothetical protein